RVALLSSLIPSVVSCDADLLNTVPNDRISSKIYWQSPNDALLAVNSLYSDLEGTVIFSYDAMTDIAHTNDPFDVQANISNGNYDALNTVIYTRWAEAYKGIAAANYFLENVDRVAFADPVVPKRYKAEARTLRAYQYIKLASLFGDVPLVERSLTLAEARSLTRTPVSDIWDFVDRELEAAATDLPDTYAEAKDRGRITKWAAHGLKARAALYAGQWRKAADAAEHIIASTRFTLWPNYETLFKYVAENNSEVLLDKQFIKDLYKNNAFSLLAAYSQKNANNSYVPTKALVDLYQTDAGVDVSAPGSGYDPNHPYVGRDPRLHFSIYIDGDQLPNGTIFNPAPNSGTIDAVGTTYRNSTTGFLIKKYINTEDYADISNSGINIILLRYAEVLLIYAEAKIELNEIEQSVYDAVNLVRNGRNDVSLADIAVGQDQDAFREIVRRERTVELAFEGLHLADIRRWRTAETVLPRAIYGVTYEDGGVFKVVQVSSANRSFRADRDYLWPIPQKERDLNKNLTQNTNW
ncbi:MAG: RagB/SusD family nutrient uptake outer membrane protein, partial [Rikenellaceae bacterium]|nr:RagB/SusD family nutrient uptake outer membrane protein [Rikenellaceae bacterium]